MPSTPVGSDHVVGDSDVLHWRMPGEDDPGQKARQALYDLHLLMSSSEDEESGASPDSDGDDKDGASHELTSTSMPILAPAKSKRKQSKKSATAVWDAELDELDQQRESRHDLAFAAAHLSHPHHQQPMNVATRINVDGAGEGVIPLDVDRRFVREVVRERMNREVVRIRFISAGELQRAWFSHTRS